MNNYCSETTSKCYKLDRIEHKIYSILQTLSNTEKYCDKFDKIEHELDLIFECMGVRYISKSEHEYFDRKVRKYRERVAAKKAKEAKLQKKEISFNMNQLVDEVNKLG